VTPCRGVRRALTMLAVGIAGASCLAAQTESEFQQDFEVAIKRIAAAYAYFDTKATRWNDLPALYAADVRDVKSRDDFTFSWSGSSTSCTTLTHS
jgi:tricorn protease-like protein